MAAITEQISHIFKDSSLRKKILFTLFGLVLFRLLAAVPIPGVDLAQLQTFLQGNQFLGLLNVFSGSGLSTVSIIMLGVGPYITASIIMQLMTMVFPKLKALYQEEGDAGRAKFTQYSRRLTVLLAALQGYSFLILLSRQGLIADLSVLGLITNVTVITAGSLLLMWIGELISEYGIGNGLSLIIFAGIVAALPTHAGQLWAILQADPTKLTVFIGFAFLALLSVWAVVAITQAERSIPVTYAKQVRGQATSGGASTYLPLRINQAGVMPIIFALSLLLLPQMVFGFLKLSSIEMLKTISEAVLAFLANQTIYAILYFVLVFVFTYFYTAVVFDPKSIAENLQKNGAYVPGVRPGESTAVYLARVVGRVTFVGALFLSLIAVLPLVMQAVSGNTAFAIGGTALLIVVSVILDVVQKVEAQVSMRQY